MIQSTEDTACCQHVATTANCAVITYNTGTDMRINNRFVYGSTNPTSGPWSNQLPAVHDDLVIAATNQLSWDGATGNRGTDATNYCDVIRKDFTATQTLDPTDNVMKPTTYDFKTTAGLVGTKKCSYIITTAEDIGAPGFRLKRADWTAFQFHFMEAVLDSNIKQVTSTSTSPGYYGDYN